MADFNTALHAHDCMRKSVASIAADAMLTEQGRADAMLKNAEDYAEHLRIPVDQARAFVAKTATDAGLAPAIIQKVTPKDETREAADRAAAAGRKLQRQNDPRHTDPEPAPVDEEEKPMKQASKAEALKFAQRALADEVTKIRTSNPKLNESQARSRFYSENPGFRKNLVELSGREYGQRAVGQELAKRLPATAEFMAKVEAINAAEPTLTGAQAYTKAYTDRANADIVKRMNTEQRSS